MEADSGLQLWCNALNEYLLDTDGRLSLSNILNKGLSLYSSADAGSVSGTNSMDCSGSGKGGRNQSNSWRSTKRSNSSDLDELHDQDTFNGKKYF